MPMRTSSKVVLALLGIGGITYVGRKCWRNVRRGSARLPNERERQGQRGTEECPTPSAQETTTIAETPGAIQAISQGGRRPLKDLRKWLVIVRSAVLDLSYVVCYGLLSYRHSLHMSVGVLEDYSKGDSLLNTVIDSSLWLVSCLVSGAYFAGKLVPKIAVWKYRLNGELGSPAHELEAPSSVNSDSESSEDRGMSDGFWRKLKAIGGAVYDQFMLWGEFASIEQHLLMKKLSLELNEAQETQIEALQSSNETLQAEVIRLQTILTRDFASVETVRVILYERDRILSLTAYQ